MISSRNSRLFEQRENKGDWIIDKRRLRKEKDFAQIFLIHPAIDGLILKLDFVNDLVKQDFIHLEQYVISLIGTISKLKEELNQLQVRVSKSSINSDKPPSSDNPYKPRQQKKKQKEKKRPGAKIGHKGHRQKLMPPTTTIDILPDQCDCENDQFENLRPYYTHQEIELPEFKMEVKHFILHQGDCTECGKTVKAAIPLDHKTGYCVHFSSFIGMSAGIQGNSRSTIHEFCRSVLKIDISLGAIQKIIDRVSEAIEPCYQAIAKSARNSEINYIDETSWKKNGTLMFLWAMVNSYTAFFKIHKERSREAFLALIENWKGILVSDGYNVYQKWVNLRQPCLVHLIRHARGLSEHPRCKIQAFGEKIYEKLQQLCSMAKNIPTEQEWNDFYVGFIDLLFDHCNRFCKDEAGKFARRLLKEIDSLWIFLEVSGVEPTNNRAERGLRFSVLWRKRSQGTISDKGNQWVERILSLRQTARLRGISCYDILLQAVSAYFKEQKPDVAWV